MSNFFIALSLILSPLVLLRWFHKRYYQRLLVNSFAYTYDTHLNAREKQHSKTARDSYGHACNIIRFIFGRIGRIRKNARNTSSTQKKKATLPLILEKISMLVRAGLDIGPAIERIAFQHHDTSEGSLAEDLRAVLQLTQGGLSLSDALSTVASQSHIIQVKHSFLHLAAAHRDGGEILYQLEELADATQAAYQEEVDEAISKLPIKATLPLILIFSGLLITLMTAPILEVVTITATKGGQ